MALLTTNQRLFTSSLVVTVPPPPSRRVHFPLRAGAAGVVAATAPEAVSRVASARQRRPARRVVATAGIAVRMFLDLYMVSLRRIREAVGKDLLADFKIICLHGRRIYPIRHEADRPRR